MLLIIKNTQLDLYIMIAACIPLEIKKRACDCAQEYTHVDLSLPSAMYMEAEVNVSHQLRALLSDLVNKRMNANTCNKPSASFYRKYVVCQMILSTHCIALKMTYGMKDITYFLICKLNIMSFFCWVVGGVGNQSYQFDELSFGTTLKGGGVQ